MKLQLTPYILLVAIVLYSCGNESVNPTELASSYTNLETGNFWVYEWYQITPEGEESLFTHTRDSIYISGDTLIEGRKYIVRSGTFLNYKRTEILMDSANSLYQYPSKTLLFTLDTSKESIINIGTEENPIGQAKYSLNSNPVVVNVSAGDFECLSYEGLFESFDQDYPYGNTACADQYAKNVGLVVKKTKFYNSPNTLEMRLIKFGNKE